MRSSRPFLRIVATLSFEVATPDEDVTFLGQAHRVVVSDCKLNGFEPAELLQLHVDVHLVHLPLSQVAHVLRRSEAQLPVHEAAAHEDLAAFCDQAGVLFSAHDLLDCQLLGLLVLEDHQTRQLLVPFSDLLALGLDAQLIVLVVAEAPDQGVDRFEVFFLVNVRLALRTQFYQGLKFFI